MGGCASYLLPTSMRSKLQERRKRPYKSEKLQFSYDTSDTEWLMTSSNDFCSELLLPPANNSTKSSATTNPNDNGGESCWKTSKTGIRMTKDITANSSPKRITAEKCQGVDKLPFCLLNDDDDDDSDQDEDIFQHQKFQDFPINTEPRSSNNNCELLPIIPCPTGKTLEQLIETF